MRGVRPGMRRAPSSRLGYPTRTTTRRFANAYTRRQRRSGGNFRASVGTPPSLPQVRDRRSRETRIATSRRFARNGTRLSRRYQVIFFRLRAAEISRFLTRERASGWPFLAGAASEESSTFAEIRQDGAWRSRPSSPPPRAVAASGRAAFPPYIARARFEQPRVYALAKRNPDAGTGASRRRRATAGRFVDGITLADYRAVDIVAVARCWGAFAAGRARRARRVGKNTHSLGLSARLFSGHRSLTLPAPPSPHATVEPHEGTPHSQAGAEHLRR